MIFQMKIGRSRRVKAPLPRRATLATALSWMIQEGCNMAKHSVSERGD